MYSTNYQTWRNQIKEKISIRHTGATLLSSVVCLLILTADINGLKHVNDTLGHEAGDELVRGAANCLRECFGEYGSLFRVGGDEFAGILMLPEEKLAAARSRLESTLAAWRGEQTERLYMAAGFASLREFPASGIAALTTISDERMYEAKQRYYRSTGIERRTSDKVIK